MNKAAQEKQHEKQKDKRKDMEEWSAERLPAGQIADLEISGPAFRMVVAAGCGLSSAKQPGTAGQTRQLELVGSVRSGREPLGNRRYPASLRRAGLLFDAGAVVCSVVEVHLRVCSPRRAHGEAGLGRIFYPIRYMILPNPVVLVS